MQVGILSGSSCLVNRADLKFGGTHCTAIIILHIVTKTYTAQLQRFLGIVSNALVSHVLVRLHISGGLKMTGSATLIPKFEKEKKGFL